MGDITKTDNNVADINESSTLLAVLQRAATDPACDMDKMERLWAMHEKAQGRQAEQEFNQAMNHAQSQMRRIATDCNNPQTRSRYASYGALDRALRPVYSNEGFSLSFDTDEGAPADHLRVVCYVSHTGGHTRRYKVDMPNDGKGAKGGDVMTKTHAQGSAMSYGMRYLLKAIFNVAIGEDDDDGNGAGNPISEEQAIKADEFLQAIAEADTIAGLRDNVGQSIAKSGLPGQLLRNVRGAYTARLNALRKAEEK